jgi:broad specificity phosphatase PhoE
MLYLIRHGQAGLRSHYDTLSDTGREQARLLGPALQAEARFAHVLTGSLHRQQETARAAGFTGFEVDAGWSEFDLDAVYREVAPQLAEADAGFREEYELLQRQAKDDGAAVHRKWTRTDIVAIRAWVEGRVAVRETETFAEFAQRIRAAYGRALAREGNVAIFTSATPIGLVLAEVLETPGVRAMRLAGAVLNASYTVLRRQPEPALFGFNAAAHLPENLRTFR